MIKLMKLLILYLMPFIFIGCAQRIKVPINRMIEPEAIGGGAAAEYRQTGFSRGVLSFENNSTKNPLSMSSVIDKEFYFAIGLNEISDLFVRVPEESSSLVGLKIQLLGAPSKAGVSGHNIAFTIGTGSERDDFDQTFTISLKSDIFDFSLIHGYRFNPYLAVYDGVSISSYRFEGEIDGAVGLDSDEISYHANNIQGAFIGLVFGSHTFKLKTEYAVQKIKWSNTEEEILHAGSLSLAAGW